MVTKYKNEVYKGQKITFVKANSGRLGVHARAPNVTQQILGMGRTKEEAFEELKDIADRIDKAGNW